MPTHAAIRAKRRRDTLAAAGRCTGCGCGGATSPLKRPPWCFKCRKRRQLRQRVRAGCRPWRPGGRGRPPTC